MIEDWNRSDAPRGQWLRVGTPADEPYPCQCRTWGRGCSPKWCPCSGRTDVENVPTTCCAFTTNTPAVAAAAQRG